MGLSAANEFLEILNNKGIWLEQQTVQCKSELIESITPHPCSQNLKQDFSKYNEDLHMLFSNYDMSKLELGHIEFRHEIEDIGEYLIFADGDAASLAISTKSFSVVEIDGSGSRVGSCGSNFSTFLTALTLGVNLLVDYLVNQNFGEDERACLFARRCADLAGGDENLPFYSSLLGCWK